MGLFKDVRDLQSLGKEAQKGYDPVAQAKAASEQMRQMVEQQQAAAAAGPATTPAMVVGLADTGTFVNHQPMFDVEVTVLPSDGPAFGATLQAHGHTTVVNQAPGTLTHVRFDGADRAAVSF
jgi:hypothetical protein